MAGACGTVDTCEPDTIRERYRVVFKAGAAPPVPLNCGLSDLIFNNQIDYHALVDWVSSEVPRPAADPCIPLANINVTPDDGHCCDPKRIDITVRPIVYTNDLLFQIILALMIKPAAADARRAK